jgi:peptide-methionine (S)-S-oxide reductase
MKERPTMEARKSDRHAFPIALGIVVAGLMFVAILLMLPERTQGTEQTMENHRQTETATLGGGCFWCLEAVFERLPGVVSVTSGYAGGSVLNPTYKQVCEGNTGHAEVVQIDYDPDQITFAQILDLFWQAHDPTTPNRQGADVGTQYRSIILYHSGAQRVAAEKSVAALSAAGTYSSPIVTEIVPLERFFKAEGYHQDYFRNNPNAPYCSFVIAPKLKKLHIK